MTRGGLEIMRHDGRRLTADMEGYLLDCEALDAIFCDGYECGVYFASSTDAPEVAAEKRAAHRAERHG